MPTATATVTVAHPIDEVFDFLADGSNNPSWRRDVSNVILASGPLASAVWVQTIAGPGNRTTKGDYRISAYEHPSLLEFVVVAGPSRPTGLYRLRSLAATSTEVSFTLYLRDSWYLRPLRSRIAAQLDAEVATIGALPAALDR